MAEVTIIKIPMDRELKALYLEQVHTASYLCPYFCMNKFNISKSALLIRVSVQV